MKYSVYNESTGSYTVYEGPPTERLRLLAPSSLGSTPRQVSGYLPMGSVCLGQSEAPEGQIVEKDRDMKSFLMELAIILPITLIAKAIYDWLRK